MAPLGRERHPLAPECARQLARARGYFGSSAPCFFAGSGSPPGSPSPMLPLRPRSGPRGQPLPVRWSSRSVKPAEATRTPETRLWNPAPPCCALRFLPSGDWASYSSLCIWGSGSGPCALGWALCSPRPEGALGALRPWPWASDAGLCTSAPCAVGVRSPATSVVVSALQDAGEERGPLPIPQVLDALVAPGPC